MSALNRVNSAHLVARDAAPVVGTYICDPEACPDAPPSLSWGRNVRLARPGHGHCWHESVARRLEWQGGPSEGAQADLSAWNSLGSRA